MLCGSRQCSTRIMEGMEYVSECFQMVIQVAEEHICLCTSAWRTMNLLKWPFNGDVSIQILGSTRYYIDRFEKTLGVFCHGIIAEVVASSQRFISHSSLSKYVFNDSLVIGIPEVNQKL